MEFPLHSCCAYLATIDVDWRDEDYASRFVTLAVKNDNRLKGRARIPFPDGARTVTVANKIEAVRYFVGWASAKLAELDIERPVIIPIPGHSITPAATNFRNGALAAGIANIVPNAIAAPILRFREPVEKAQKGGPRGSLQLSSHMVLVGGIPDGDIVLMDDVVSSGGHMRAARRIIETNNRQVTCALTCGRTVHQLVDDPFNLNPEELDPLAGFF